jgi:hypothetical protein
MIKNLKQIGVHEIFRFIITLLSMEYGILKIHSIFDYVKKPVGFLFRRIPTIGRDSSPLRKADDTPISGACYTSACQSSHVDGCCEAAAYGIHS